MIEELILKFKNGECTDVEYRAVLQYFKQNPEVLQKYMTEDDWNKFEETEDIPSILFKKMYDHISDKIKPEKYRLFKLRRIVAVAAVILITFSVYYLFKQNNMNDPRIKAASISDRQHVFKDTTVRNNGNSVLFVRLSDSSTVKIFPGGSLNYLKIFEHNQRNLILLKGKAVFYVTKDKKRPFTVYAGNTATTALGTIFTVNKDAVTNSVNVHLYKGAVVIKEHSESAEGKVLAYLKPGNEFCNLCEENYTRMNETPKPRNQTVSVSEASAHISFDNVPLSEVFDSIQVKEHIHFYYKKKDIDNISYTGVYDIKKENLYEFLNTVALLNNLSIHTTDSLTYRVNVKN